MLNLKNLVSMPSFVGRNKVIYVKLIESTIFIKIQIGCFGCVESKGKIPFFRRSLYLI